MTNEERDRTRPEWPKFEERHYRDEEGTLLVAEWRHFMPPRMDWAKLTRMGPGDYHFLASAFTAYRDGGGHQQPQIEVAANFTTPEGKGSAAIRLARALFAEFAGAAEKRKESRLRYRASLRTKKLLAAVAARTPRDAKGRFARKGA